MFPYHRLLSEPLYKLTVKAKVKCPFLNEINVSYKNIGQIEIKNLLKAEPCLTEWHNIVSESSQQIEKKTTEEEVVEYIRRATVCLVS